MKKRSTEAWPVGAQLKNPVTIEDMPDWVQNGDVIVKRGNRHFVISTHESEPRWRAWLRKLRGWLRSRNERSGRSDRLWHDARRTRNTILDC